MDLKPHQQRVVDEKADLDIKLTKLNEFIDSRDPGSVFDNLSAEDRALLVEQEGIMAAYSDVLKRRIARF